MFLSEGHLPFILQVKPLDAAPHQVLPARLHGGPEQAGVQRRDLTCGGGGGREDVHPLAATLSRLGRNGAPVDCGMEARGAALP